MKIIYSMLIFTALTISTPSYAKTDTQSIVRIDIGEENYSDTAVSKKELYRRLYRLEKAVKQLQERVFELEIGSDLQTSKDKKAFTCFIKTGFKGTFTSTKNSLTAAKADVMKQCSDVVKYGMDCDEDKVKCGE